MSDQTLCLLSLGRLLLAARIGSLFEFDWLLLITPVSIPIHVDVHIAPNVDVLHRIADTSASNIQLLRDRTRRRNTLALACMRSFVTAHWRGVGRSRLVLNVDWRLRLGLGCDRDRDRMGGENENVNVVRIRDSLRWHTDHDVLT